MTGDLAPAISFATALRDAGVRAQLHCEKKKFKQKLSYADKLHIPYVVFLGEDELAAGTASVKELASGEQSSVQLTELPAFIHEKLGCRPQPPIILESQKEGE